LFGAPGKELLGGYSIYALELWLLIQKLLLVWATKHGVTVGTYAT